MFFYLRSIYIRAEMTQRIPSCIIHPSDSESSRKNTSPAQDRIPKEEKIATSTGSI